MEMELTKKWAPILDHKSFEPIRDPYRRSVTATLLENQEVALEQERKILTESAPANVSGNVLRYDPVLISLIRRMAPNMIHYDVAGVQPLTLPTGLIFAMRARFGTGATGPLNTTIEALFDEANTAWGGTGTHDAAILPSGMGATGPPGGFGTGFTTAGLEGLGMRRMGFTIERVTVEARTRGLSADYSIELAQDMKNTHQLDADNELSNILTTEILAEMNRELIRTIYRIARYGALTGTTTAGAFDLDVDSDGRWAVERFKGLLFHVEREANAVARTTRRGRGNLILCSSDVASALAMAGRLDYAPALSTELVVDDTGNTFAGVLDKKYKVFIDPYFSSAHATFSDILVVGYKGSNPYDAGLFYCPYVPLIKMEARDPLTLQPVIGFKTRYGMVSNPLVGDGATLANNSNHYYRRVLISNLM